MIMDKNTFSTEFRLSVEQNNDAHLLVVAP